MSYRIGGVEANKLYLGGTEAQRVYKGEQLVWEKPQPISSIVATSFDNDITGWAYEFGTGTITNPTGVISYKLSASTAASLSWVSQGEHADVEILAKVRPVTLRRPFGVTARVSGDSSNRQGYYLSVDQATGQATLWKFSGATFAAITGAVNASITLVAGTYYLVRLRVTGSSLQGKVWEFGTAEPASWMVTATDSTYLSGRVGLFEQSHFNTRECDYFAYSTDGSTIPLPT